MKSSISNRVSQRANSIRRCIGLSVVAIALNLSILSVAQAATDCHAVTEISTIECESLLEFYNSLDGDNWINNNGWNVTDTPCSWYAISCQDSSLTHVKTVTGISFGWFNGNNHHLKGSLPNFSGLPNLERLYISLSQVTGPIPDFSGLPNLKELYLSDNQLSGPIPDFSGLPNLRLLALNNNQLTGPIPDFSALPNLKDFSLENNQLSGPIPDFSAVPKLQVLHLGGNQLTGSIPNFSALPKLLILFLEKNKLSGSIPDFSLSPSLYRLSIYDNNQFCKAPNIDYSDYPINIDTLPDCSHTLTLTKTGEGEGNISGNGIDCGSNCIKEYVENTSITLTATPDADSIFAGWNGACSGTDNCTLTMNQSQNVTAIFIKPKPVLLTITPTGGGQGIITSEPSGINCDRDCAHEYDNNSVITLTADADADSIFEGWGGACSGDAATCVVQMSNNKTVSAQFNSCKATVEPSSQTHQFNADKGSITVKVSNDKCAWTAISHNDWLKITSNQNNHGNGTIEYFITENSDTEPREGKLTIAGQTLTLYQGIFEKHQAEKPQASFTATPLSGMAPLTVKLDASDSSDQNGEIVSYEWITSDGQTASGKTAELIFAGDKSCRPTIMLTVTNNDDLFAQTDKTLSIENCAIIKFQGIETAYKVGDFVRAEVKIEVNIGGFKRVDLWVAILMPSGELIFKTPLGINAFSFFAQPFKESLESQTVVQRLLDFEVPRGLGGTYTFYGLIVDEGEDPNKHLDELVIQEFTLAK